MTIYRLGPQPLFPDPEEADPSGLLAVGGDLSVPRLLAAYRAGIFPWYDEPPILWFSPDPRMVLVPAELHVPKRLERTLRQGRFEVRFDHAFGEVMRACAEAPRAGEAGTWITDDMLAAYCELHERGHAHSAEAWRGGELVGGVYGLALGRAFFAESMFFRERDASKIALVALVRRLAAWRFPLVDCQQYSDHVARFGAREWPRERFLRALQPALRSPPPAEPWTQPVAALNPKRAPSPESAAASPPARRS